MDSWQGMRLIPRLFSELSGEKMDKVPIGLTVPLLENKETLVKD